MRIALATLVLAAGCLNPAAYKCIDASDCARATGQGVCEPSGYCSFDDPGCGAGGRRYGDLSGPFANQCVAGEDPTADGDGDGLPNVSDNCRDVANPLQEDEDADLVGDVCDACPISMTNGDGDGDGVGDACDPNPTTPGDALVVFTGFVGAALPAGWQTSQAVWTVAGGDIAVTATGQNQARLTYPTTSTKETVSTSVTIVDVMGNLNSAGTVDNHRAGSNSSIHCNVFHNQIFGNPVGVGVLDTNNLQTLRSSVYEMNPGSTYQLVQTRNGDAYTCVASRAGTQATVTGTYGVANDPRGVGLMAYSSSVRFHWVLVVRSP